MAKAPSSNLCVRIPSSARENQTARPVSDWDSHPPEEKGQSLQQWNRRDSQQENGRGLQQVDGAGVQGEPTRDGVSPPTVSQDKFSMILIEVNQWIVKRSLRDVAFLCFDKVREQRVLEEAKSAMDIFADMTEYGTLNRENVGLVAELLYRVGLVKVSREAFRGTGITWPTEGVGSGTSYLDEFRCLLYDIAKQLSGKMLKKLKEFCSLRITEIGHDLEELKDVLDLFELLEDHELIASDNIGLLHDFSESVFKNHNVKSCINAYEERRLAVGRPVLTVTEKEAEKILRLANLSLDPENSGSGILPLTGYYGHEKYEKIAKAASGQKGAGKTLLSQMGGGLNQPSFHRASPGPGLITPAMLTGQSSEQPMSVDGDEDSLPSQLPPEEPAAALQSNQEIQTDGDTDDRQYLTFCEDTYHKKFQFPYYRMDAKPRGICLIISNKTFTDGVSTEREGTEKDVESLRSLFESFHFEVVLMENLTGDKMKRELKRWQNYDHSPYNAFVCCVLSHGNRGFVIGKDGTQVELSKIIGYFKGQNCKTLIGKPKVFIIQACQGDRWQRLTNEPLPRSPTQEASGIGMPFESLPMEVDILLLLSTVPGYKSARSGEKGSWFIMALTHVWRMIPDAEAQSVVTIVNNMLSKTKAPSDKKDGTWVTQTAFPSNTLRKMLFLKHPDHLTRE